MTRRILTGWSSTERRSPTGAVEFEQLVTSTRPLVAYSEAGARELAERYWREVETATRRLVRARHREGAVALLLFGRWTLLRFDAPRTVVDDAGVLTSFAITGGPLVRTPGGSITFSQSAQPHVQLRATIDGFFPRLGGRANGPAWTGRSLPARPATHPHGHQPPLLRAADRRGGSMRVVVFGATGTIGQALVPVLAGAHDVVAVSRTQRPSEGNVTWAKADASDPPSVRAALAGADVAYYLVHSLGSSDFERRDREAAETVAREASPRA